MLLLDTCTLLWLNESPPRLPAPVIERIRADAGGGLYVSAMTALEIAIKARKGRIRLPAPSPRAWFYAVVAERGLVVIAITASIAFASGALPDLHKDPADRVIIATALEGGLAIVTPDPLIRQYPSVEVVWG